MSNKLIHRVTMPAAATEGDLVTFNYTDAHGNKSFRTGLVAQTNIDRILLEDFTEDGKPRMFLFPRMQYFEVLEFPTPKPTLVRKTFGYHLKRIFGFGE